MALKPRTTVVMFSSVPRSPAVLSSTQQRRISRCVSRLRRVGQGRALVVFSMTLRWRSKVSKKFNAGDSLKRRTVQFYFWVVQLGRLIRKVFGMLSVRQSEQVRGRFIQQAAYHWKDQSGWCTKKVFSKRVPPDACPQQD